MNLKVLIADSDEHNREIYTSLFNENGYTVEEASDGITAIDLISQDDYDIILLNTMLRDIDGFSVLKKVRTTNAVPVILFSSLDNEEDILFSYQLGADDFFTLPANPKLLLAKANALIKRVQGRICLGENELCASGIVINQNSHTVSVDNEYIDLTPKEYELLSYFIINKGKVLSRDTLLSKIWGYDYFGDLRTVDTHIKKLRAKLKEKGSHIKTLIKVGYRFDEEL